MTVQVKVERGALVDGAEVQICTAQHHFVILGDAARHDFAAGGHHQAACNAVHTLFHPALGHAGHPAAVLVGPGLHRELVVEQRQIIVLRRGCVVYGRVVANKDHLRALQRHDAVTLGPAAVVAQRHAHGAAKGLVHTKVFAGCEVTFFQMLEFAPGLVLEVTGHVDLAVLAHNLAALVHEDGGVVLHELALFLRQLGIAQVKANAQIACQLEQRHGVAAGHFALVVAVQLGLIFDVPAREKGGQRQLGIDNNIRAQALGLAHHFTQTLDHAGTRIGFLHGPQLAQGNIDNTAHF